MIGDAKVNVLSTDRQRTEQEAARVLERIREIPALEVTATTSGTAQTLFTVGAKFAFEASRLHATNTTASPITLSLHVIPTGDSIGTANAEFYGQSIQANSRVSLYYGGQEGWWQPEATVKVYASGAGLTLHGWGKERY